MTGNVNISDLETFILVVSSGSITAAAKTLGVPKSTVSRRIKRLETELDQPLVARSPNRIRLTTQGTLLYERCEPAIAAIHSAGRELHGLGEEPIGTLRVTVLSAMSLAPALSELFLEFVAEHPRVTLEVIASNQVIDLVEDRIDLALRPAGSAVTTGDARLRSRALGVLQPALFASPEYIERHGEPTRVEQLGDHLRVLGLVFKECVMLEGPRNKQYKVHARPRYYTSSLAHVADATHRGTTVGILLPAIAQPECARGRLVPILDGWRVRGSQIDLVYPATAVTMAKTRAMITFLRERAVPSGLLSEV
ncbi:MAG: LysR family transcriptional regulator [Myxococcales bacterium FL481]|nr:MAG: LysR family transcriptional regulator [Myxococcales bacterium FL481]